MRSPSQRSNKVPLLINIDPVFLRAIDDARAHGPTPGTLEPRTVTVRALLREALDARLRAKGETPPAIEIAQQS